MHVVCFENYRHYELGERFMKKMVSFKAPLAMSAILVAMSMSLTGCSGDSEEATAKAPVAEQPTKAMDVKPPEAQPAPMQPLVAEPAKVEAVKQEVEQKVEEVKTEVKAKAEEVVKAAAPAAPAAPSGDKLYSTCVGCHGAMGEGGVGPRLNNQTPADIVAKLELYKSGAEVGPMTAMMAPMAMPLSAEDMQVIADYITSK